MASNAGQDSSTQNNEFAKLSWRERIAYGAGDFAQNLIFGTIGSMLLFYLTTVYGISAAAGATIFLIVRWINVFLGSVGRRIRRPFCCY